MGLCQGTGGNPIYAQYDLHEKLGSGTFATVRRIVNKKDPSDEKALKITSLRNLKSEEIAALRNEVTILQQIQHKHVVMLYDHFQTTDKIYMVQDLLSGGELFDRIIELTYFSEKEAAKCVKQIACALTHLHKNNVVHRDLKPENLLLTSKHEDYDIKIIDFGLAKQSTELMTMPCGTPGYVAPEILKRRKYHKEVDVWSLGVITYILLCGFPPFHDDGNNLKNLYKQIRAGKYSFPAKYWDNISKEAKDLIRKMLQVKPKTRITAAAILDDPWVVSGAPATNLSEGHKVRLRQTQALAKLRKGVRVLLALQKMLSHTNK